MNFQASLFVTDHKDAYKQIRNFLAGQFVGATRDRALLAEVAKCLFCKVYLQTHQNGSAPGEADLNRQYRQALDGLKKTLPSIFHANDEILLDAQSLAFVDRAFNEADLSGATRDYFGDLYEVFVSTGIREEEGQFFTPQNGIELLVSMVNPQPGERVIDPACGAGGFLAAVASHLRTKGAAHNEIVQSIIGIDKDAYLVQLAATRLAILTLQPGQVYCADSLAWSDENGRSLPLPQSGSYDVVLTNPPFGKRIVAASRQTQKYFTLGYTWKKGRDGRYQQTGDLLNSAPPQVLFVEKCLELLRPGGRLGIVVPESMITSKTYSHVVQYMRSQGEIKAVIGLPEEFFKTSGKGGTHTKACLVMLHKHEHSNGATLPSGRIFMAEAKWCGHDSRGRRIDRDDLPLIQENLTAFHKGQLRQFSSLGYAVDVEQLVNNILSPRYYSPELDQELEQLAETHDLVKLGDLVTAGELAIQTGDEVGKMAYGTGIIPFVRTSDISNWEIKIDPKHGVSSEIYEKFATKQDIRVGDILMVKDGTYLIGTCAFITEYDTQIVYQSHLYKLRLNDQSRLSPYLLLALLSSEPVQRQIKAKRFTQDIIDSLGQRIHELILPIPKSQQLRQHVSQTVEQAIRDRIEARELARKACLDVVGQNGVAN
ncbi:MAG: N-6 DNA methylase [Anaerolinea sp.]|nr:N-6 DNA methylase [Anaerolinea sp.]